MSGTAGRHYRILYHALMRHGGKHIPIYRQDADANGIPKGEIYQVGTLFGLIVKGRTSGNIHIDLPGIIVGGDNLRHATGLLTSGPPPQKGDRLCSPEGERLLDVTIQSILYDLSIAGE